MTTHPDESNRSCSFLSGLLGDPLMATALETSGWILVEHPGPWGKNAIRESGLDPSAVAEIDARMNTTGVRVQLISPPPGRDAGWCYVGGDGTADGGGAWLGALPAGDLDTVLALDFAQIAAGVAPAGLQAVTQPLYLVCANENSDPCCGARGVQVHTAAAGLVGSRARRTAHVGGHKYAANMVVFPYGNYYGRLDERSVASVVAATEAGDLYLDKWRGRSTYTCAEQAADHFARTRLGLVGLADTRLLERARPVGPDQQEVRIGVAGGGEHLVRVSTREQQPARLQSCTDHRETVPVEWIFEAMTATTVEIA